MKTTLVALGVVVIVGGGVYALVPRTVLKSFFQTGDKPTETQFADTIDSAMNLQDDGQSTGAKEYTPTKEYLVGDAVVKTDAILQAKILTEKQKEFKLDSDQTVTFRWTPIVPKPKESVTYRLKVWQLMQGQNSTQAMKTNAPIVTKEVTNGSEVTVSGLYTGPCKPPFLCEFVWSVESMSAATVTPAPDTGSTVAPTSDAADTHQPGTIQTQTDGSSTGARTN